LTAASFSSENNISVSFIEPWGISLKMISESEESGIRALSFGFRLSFSHLISLSPTFSKETRILNTSPGSTWLLFDATDTFFISMRVFPFTVNVILPLYSLSS
jgi:hypothetical protein